MKLSFDHQLGREGGRERLRRGIERLAAQYGSTVQNFSRTWSGDCLDFTVDAFGFRARGAALVEEARILVEVDLPLGLRVLGTAARDYLIREGRLFFRTGAAL